MATLTCHAGSIFFVYRKIELKVSLLRWKNDFGKTWSLVE